MSAAVQVSRNASGTSSKAPSKPQGNLAEVEFLPPSFEMLPRLLLLLDDAEANSEAVAEVIAVDAGLAADVLHLSNNVYFAGARRVETVQEAIIRLGLRQVYRTVMRVVASPILVNAQQNGFGRLELWKHSLASALASRSIAQHNGDDPEIAYTAGLLHDIGKVILSQVHGAPYIELIEQCKSESQPFWSREKAAFQAAHAEAGGRLLAKWNFPESISSAVAHHHTPTLAPKPHRRLAALTHIGNSLAYRIDCGYGYPEYATNPDPDLLRMIGIPENSLTAYEPELIQTLNTELARFS